METPSRKRGNEAVEKTPGFFSKLFSSAKKPKTVEHNTEPTTLPHIRLSTPSMSPSATRTTLIDRPPPSTNGLLVPMNGSGLPLHDSKPKANSWKALPEEGFTIGSFAPTTTRRRRVPYKPESRTLIANRKRSKQQAGAFTDQDLSRILERDKHLFFPKPNAEAIASFRMPTAKRRFGTNQTGSRAPSVQPTKVSFEEEPQDKRVSFQQAQTPAASDRPRLRRVQTPAATRDDSETTPKAVKHSLDFSPVPSSMAVSSNSSNSHSSSKRTSQYLLWQPSRISRLPTSEGGPFEFPGSSEPDAVSKKVANFTRFKLNASTAGDSFATLPPQSRFDRRVKEAAKKAQTEYMPDAEDEVTEPQKAKRQRAGDDIPGAATTKTIQQGWGANMFANSRGKWKCEVCHVPNEQSKNRCISCETKRPGTSDTPSTSLGGASSSTNSGAPTATNSAFSFGISTSAPPAAGGFKFGAPKQDNNKEHAEASGGAIKFGISTASDTETPAPKISFGVSDDKTTPMSKVSFGFPSSLPPGERPTTEAAKPPNTDIKPVGGSKFNFGASPAPTGGFNFQGSTAASEESKPRASGFTFGGSTMNANEKKEEATAPSKVTFQFGAPVDTTDGSLPKKRRSSDDTPKGTPHAQDVSSTSKPSVSFAATPKSDIKPFVFGTTTPMNPSTPSNLTADGPNGISFAPSSTVHAGSTPGPPSFVFGAGATPGPSAATSFGSSNGLSFAGGSTSAPAASSTTPGAASSVSFGSSIPAAPVTATPGITFGAVGCTSAAPLPFGGTPAPSFGTTTPGTPAFAGLPFAGSTPAPTPGLPFAGSTSAPAPALSFAGSTPAPAPGLSFAGSTPAPTPGLPFAGSTSAPAPGLSFAASTPAPAPGLSFAASTPAPAPGLSFAASTLAPAPDGFGAPAPTPGGFGAPASTPGGFGAPAPSSQASFGFTQPAPAAFNATSTPVPSLGAAPGPFGGTPAATPNAFVGSTPAGVFGNPTLSAGAGFGGGPFGAGGMATPSSGGFNIGTGGTKSTGRRRIIKAKRPPGSSHR